MRSQIRQWGGRCGNLHTRTSAAVEHAPHGPQFSTRAPAAHAAAFEASVWPAAVQTRPLRYSAPVSAAASNALFSTRPPTSTTATRSSSTHAVAAPQHAGEQQPR